MITLKIKYTTTEDGLNLIKEYRKQYSSLITGDIKALVKKNIEYQISLLNNIPLVKSYLKRCAVKNATQLIKYGD